MNPALLKALLSALPNAAQGFSLTRAGIQGVGASIATTGVTTGDWPLAGIGGALWLAPAIWGLFAHTEDAKIAAVEALPGATILVHPTVPPDTALMAAALDRDRPHVQLAKAA